MFPNLNWNRIQKWQKQSYIWILYDFFIPVKSAKTAKRENCEFWPFLDREGHFFDTILFPPIAEKFSFRGLGIYAMYGKVTEEFDFLSIEISKMRKEAYITDPRYAENNLATGHRIEKMKSLEEKKEVNINL